MSQANEAGWKRTARAAESLGETSDPTEVLTLIDGVRTFSRTIGTGADVVLIHGALAGHVLPGTGPRHRPVHRL
jgi:hypothetical protein